MECPANNSDRNGVYMGHKVIARKSKTHISTSYYRKQVAVSKKKLSDRNVCICQSCHIQLSLVN